MAASSHSSNDYVIVGSGINSLVCAALLAKTGKSVLVLERSDRAGGCIRSEELTVPGFMHDVLSGWHPLFVLSPAYAELGADLHQRGLTYLNTETPTASISPDGKATVLTTSRESNIRTFEALHPGDGDAYRISLAAIESSADLTFGLLGGELWRFATLKLLFSEIRKRGLRGTAEFFGTAMGSCRSWLNSHFRSDAAKTLFAPWILHTGLSPDAAISGHMGKLIAFSLEVAGMPVVEGGSQGLVAAFTRLIEDNGSAIICDADVERIITRNGSAHAVQTIDGREFEATKAIICNVNPTQLYDRFLAHEVAVPAKLRDEAANYRYGRADMQIHLALDAPPTWVDSALESVPMIHVTEGMEAISQSIAETDNGLLPSRPTIVVGQPTAVDPSRAPNGKWIVWIQLQELPSKIRGDSLGEIEPEADGAWTDEIRDRYADRIIDRLSLVMPNLKDLIIGRAALSPRDLEAINMNLIGGDPYCGDCSIDQFFLWRPLPSSKNHETPIRDLYQIGASTHPGPGLGAGSGYAVGKLLGG